MQPHQEAFAERLAFAEFPRAQPYDSMWMLRHTLGFTRLIATRKEQP